MLENLRVGEELLTLPAPKSLWSHTSACSSAGLAQVWVGRLFITGANGGEQIRLIEVLGTNVPSSSQPGLIRMALGTSLSLPERKAAR